MEEEAHEEAEEEEEEDEVQVQVERNPAEDHEDGLLLNNCILFYNPLHPLNLPA